MKVSVIIPCHNSGPWIVGALLSVARQIYLPHEIIVIDDASTDDSVAQIEASGVPVKLLHLHVRNAATARNSGIEEATGNWIALLDADDIWYPNHLARAVDLLNASNDVAFMSNHDWIGLQNELLPMPDEFRCKLMTPCSGLDIDRYFQLLEAGFHFGHSTVLYKLDYLRSVGMFDSSQRRRHDMDLWIRMIAHESWTYDVVSSVGYRENTPGSLSKIEAECDYFYLRALVKNADHVRSHYYRQHLARQARRAMGIAFVDGPAEHYRRIRDLAWPHLEAKYRTFYRCAAVFPTLTRGVMKAKRRFFLPESLVLERPAVS